MRLLIVGTLSGQIGAASQIARDRGAKVSQVTDIDKAHQMICEGHGADAIMVEVQFDIARLVSLLKADRISTPIIACGIETSAKIAADAIRAGAKEYIPLPPDEELIAAVLEAISEESHSVIHGSPIMQRLLAMAEQIATSDASVLITGESGTGKEVIARFIHRKSVRSAKPFVAVNCAAIPANLMESELFGHEKGAFTGALNRRVGKFEEANHGTLLLDEISEMDVGPQSKLLRAIQEREIDRVGGTKPVKVDIRILATSNRDLEAEVKKGTFREDLYYRLNVISIPLPKLADRIQDIAPLSEYFIEKYSKANGVNVRPLSAAALTKLQAYHWPGNVRELENIMHRAVLLAQGSQIEEHAILLSGMVSLDAPNQRETNPAPPSAVVPVGGSASPKRSEMVGRTVEDVERELILDTLDYCLGNRTQAATILGISIRTLRNKLKHYSDSESLRANVNE